MNTLVFVYLTQSLTNFFASTVVLLLVNAAALAYAVRVVWFRYPSRIGVPAPTAIGLAAAGSPSPNDPPIGAADTDTETSATATGFTCNPGVRRAHIGAVGLFAVSAAVPAVLAVTVLPYWLHQLTVTVDGESSPPFLLLVALAQVLAGPALIAALLKFDDASTAASGAAA